MHTDDIARLTGDHRTPHISILLPTDRINKKKNIELLKKSIQKAKAALKSMTLPEDVRNDLSSKLESALGRFPETLSDGFGIFISPAQHTTLTFPFAVKHKVVVDNTFELRDLYYLKQYTAPYYVLNLSKKGVHLLKGTLNELHEIRDGKFPLLYEDPFEYEHASIASSGTSSLKGFEKEKNQIAEIRIKAVFRDADAQVRAYLGSGAKLLLAGTQRMISLFNAVTGQKKPIAGKIRGSYNDNNLDRLCESAWQTFTRSQKSDLVKQIRDMHEKRNGHVAEGLQEAWTAAADGKGLTLMVEKDLHHRAYRKEGEGSLHLDPPKKPYTIIPDAIDDLIESVRAKNGEVLFTENDQLKDVGHLALVLRY